MAVGAKIRGITIEIGADTTKLKAKMTEVNSSLSTTKAALRDTNNLLKFNPASTELIRQKQGYLKDAIAQTNAKIKEEKDALDRLRESDGGQKQSEAQKALNRDIEANKQQLKKLKSEYESVASVAGAKMQAVGENMQNVGSKLTSVGTELTTKVSLPLAAIGTAAVKVTADFDTSMSKVKAISGATGADFEKLRDKAREMGSKTKFSASEAADGMTYMAMAGWKTEDMLDGLEGIMNLAAASGEDLATTSDIVTDALTAFGLQSKDSGHFADVLAAASSNANTNVSMMGETFKYAAPIAGSLGYSVEDTAVAIGLMANAGIKGSQAGTALRTMLTKLSGDIKITGSQLGEVTIKTSNADGSMRDLSAILSDCRGAFSQLTESEKANVASSLVGQEAMSGFLAIMNAGQGDVDNLTNAIANCDGTTQQMADDMQNNLGGQLQVLKSMLEEVAIQIGDALMPTIQKVVGKIQEWVTAFSNLDEGTKETIVKIGLVIAAIGPLILIGGQLITGIGTIITTVGNLFNVLMAHPLVALVAAIGALVAAGVGWYEWTKKQAEAEYGLTEEQKNLIKTIEDEKKAYDDLKGKREEQMSATEGELKHLDNLIEEYNGYIDSNGKVKKGYEDRAEFILTTLAQAFGFERDEMDKLIDKNGRLGEEIDKLMEKKRQDAMLSAYLESYQEAIAKTEEGMKKYTEAVNARKEASEKLKIAEDNLKEAQAQLDAGNVLALFNVRKANEEVKAASAAYNETEQAVSDARTTYQDYMSTIKNYEGYQTAILANDVAGIEEWQLRLRHDFKDTETANIETLRNQEKEFDQMIEQMKIDLQNGMPGVTQEQITQLEHLRDMSLDQYAKATAEAKKGGEEAGHAYPVGVASNQNLQESKASAEKLANANLSGFSSVMALAPKTGAAGGTGFKEGVLSKKEENRSAGEQLGDASISGYTAATSGAHTKGSTTGGDLASGVKSQEGNVRSAGEADGRAAVNGFNSGAAGANSAGGQMAGNLASGVRQNSGQVSNAAHNMGSNAVQTARSVMNADSLRGAGSNLASGLWGGLSSSGSWLTRNINSWANSIISATMGAFGIHSPSKVFRDQIGVNLGLGIGEGFKESMPKVTKQMQAVAETLTESMSGVLDLPLTVSEDFSAISRMQQEISQAHVGARAIAAHNSQGITNNSENYTTNMGGITINVNAAPGQDANEIAEIVQRKIAAQTARRQAVFK